MVVVSKVYIQKYGEIMRQYPGHCDRAMWGDDVGEVFVALDRRAMFRPGHLIMGIEPTPGGPTDFCESFKIAFCQRYGLLGMRRGFYIYGEADEY